MYTFEKSREYFYEGSAREFPNRSLAMQHAIYKKDAMLAEVNGNVVKTDIDDDGKRLQVIITIER